MRDPHSKKRAYHKGFKTAAGDAPSPVTNIVSIGHAAIFHNGKMRLFAAPMPFSFLLCRFTGEARTALSSFARLAKRRCEITILSFSRSICHGGLAALTGVTGEPYPSCLSCYSHPIRPFRAPSPRGEGCDTIIPSSKKGGEAATRALNLEP